MFFGKLLKNHYGIHIGIPNKEYFDFQITILQFVEQTHKKIDSGQLNTEFYFCTVIYCLIATVCSWETL